MDEPEYAWRYQARCSGEDTNIFYPPRDKTKYKDRKSTRLTPVTLESRMPSSA